MKPFLRKLFLPLLVIALVGAGCSAPDESARPSPSAPTTREQPTTAQGATTAPTTTQTTTQATPKAKKHKKHKWGTIGVQTKTSDCRIYKSHGYAVLPDPACSPGAIDPRVTQANIQRTICVSGYTDTVRDVSESTKEDVYHEYGIYHRAPYSYEIDHIISLQLGGANDTANLYPEKYAGKYGARRKDVIESDLKRAVCAGEITLKKAQLTIAHDWLSYYLVHRG